jgi:uncharacterized damage-inducible protein DinB
MTTIETQTFLMDAVRGTLARAFCGEGVHVDSFGAFDGIDWNLTGQKPCGSPHSIFQVLNHIVYWQDKCLRVMLGEDVHWPTCAAEGWPGTEAPASEGDWRAMVERYKSELEDVATRLEGAELLAEQGKFTRLEVLRQTSSHNSYHLGQVALLRRMLGAWPPPCGGRTW